MSIGNRANLLATIYARAFKEIGECKAISKSNPLMS